MPIVTSLADFLAAPDEEIITPIPTVAPTAAPAEPAVTIPVAVTIMEKVDDPYHDFFNLLADLKRIGMSAKNLHYRAKGNEFYGIHLLSDLVYSINSLTDELVEVYFMGELGQDAPSMESVCRTATDIPVDCPSTKDDDKYYAGCLSNIVRKTINDVEDIKKTYTEIKAGTHAVLDNISQK